MATKTAASEAVGLVEVRRIGPSEARDLLDANTHNRKLRDNLVYHLAGAMTRGEWIFNGEPIRIGADGVLQDGQHRMAAVIASGTEQDFVVIDDLPPEAQDVTDMGAKRSLADILRLRGEKDVFKLAGALRLLYSYENTGTFRSPQVKATPQQLLALLESHPTIRDSVREMGWAGEVQMHPSVAIACHYLFVQEDREAAATFFTRLRLGVGLERVNPIWALRRLLMMPRKSRQMSSTYMAAIIIKAFNAYRDGTPVGILVWKPSAGERFPQILHLEGDQMSLEGDED